MGLSWQQGPLGRNPNGQFLVPGMPDRVLYDIDGIRHAAWSYRVPLDDMEAIGDLVSFEPDLVDVTLDGGRLEPQPGQSVTPHGIDRDLTIGEAGALRAAVS
jgi:hypothetical protein